MSLKNYKHFVSKYFYNGQNCFKTLKNDDFECFSSMSKNEKLVDLCSVSGANRDPGIEHISLPGLKFSESREKLNTIPLAHFAMNNW